MKEKETMQEPRASRSEVSSAVRVLTALISTALGRQRILRGRSPRTLFWLRNLYNETAEVKVLLDHMALLLAPHSPASQSPALAVVLPSLKITLRGMEKEWSRLGIELLVLVTGDYRHSMLSILAPGMAGGMPGTTVTPRLHDFSMNSSGARMKIIRDLAGVRFIPYITTECLYEAMQPEIDLSSLTSMSSDDEASGGGAETVKLKERRKKTVKKSKHRRGAEMEDAGGPQHSSASSAAPTSGFPYMSPTLDIKTKRRLDKRLARIVSTTSALLYGNPIYDALETERIVRKGANPNARDVDSGLPILFRALLAWDVAHLEVMSQNGANLDVYRWTDGATLLHAAIKSRQPGVTSSLIKLGADVSARDRKGRTPLHMACAAVLPVSVFHLLAKGADPNALDDEGTTPLGRIVTAKLRSDFCPSPKHSNRAIIAKMLLTYGARLMARDVSINAVQEAVLNHRTEAELLLALEINNDPDGTVTVQTPRGPIESTPLFLATSTSNCDAITTLVNRGAFINRLSDYRKGGKSTCLHLATRLNLHPVTAHLLSSGADPNIRDSDGWMALHTACIREPSQPFPSLSILRHLIREGADASAVLPTGRIRTCLQWAVNWSHRALVNLLIDEGSADLEARMGNGWTPFIQAAHLLTAPLQVTPGYPYQLTRLLSSKGADTLATGTEDGWTALHAACAAGDIRTARYLLRHCGLGPNTCGEGVRPLHAAASRGRNRMCVWLLQQGAAPYAPCQRDGGKTAQAIAQEAGHTDTRDVITRWVANQGSGFSDVDQGYQSGSSSDSDSIVVF